MNEYQFFTRQFSTSFPPISNIQLKIVPGTDTATLNVGFDIPYSLQFTPPSKFPRPLNLTRIFQYILKVTCGLNRHI